MSDDYKTQINNQIKDSVNGWIEDLKEKHPALLLTKQWKVKYPKGFLAGNNIIPVITGSKKGRHLIAELNIFLSDDLEFELNNVDIILKNEPFSDKKPNSPKTIPIDEPIEILNDIIVNVNRFLQNFNTPDSNVSTVPINSPSPQINIKKSSTFDINEVKKELLNSPALPEWYRTIESANVKAELAQKFAESFIHYQKQTGRKIDFVEFFKVFTEHLKNQNKLHHYCRYKGKPVTLDGNGFCTESYCSKKPYNAVCNQTTLKFGEL